MNKIIYGEYMFSDVSIVNGSILRTKSAIGDELAFDTFDVVVVDSMSGTNLIDSLSNELQDTEGTVLYARYSGAFNPRNFQKGSPATFYHDEQLIGKFYIDSITRISKYTFKLHFVSALGLLDNVVHIGGVYQSAYAGDIIADIFKAQLISSSGDDYYYEGIVPFYIKKDVKNTYVNGWLPYSTSSRDNLQQVLFAIGASITKNANGELVISYWLPTSAVEISSTRLYQGGSIQYGARPTKVVVNEHTFATTIYDTEVQLFDTASAVTNLMVLFDNPCHDLKWNGVAFTGECGANYAIVSGTGTLTGKQYTHTINTIEKTIASVQGVESIKTVENAYLVSKANSANVIERVASYYTDAEFVTYGLEITGDVQVGDRVRFVDPFGDDVTAYLLDEDINISGILKAQAKFIKNWQPNHTGNVFSDYKLLTTLNQIYHPSAEEVGKTAKVVIFGGFKGGQGGGGSTNAEGGARQTLPSHSSGSMPDGADGSAGLGGTGGSGVMCYQTDITLADQDYVLTAVGAGGTGGAGGGVGQVGSQGQLGGATVCAGMSSNSGTLLTTGFANPLTGDVYGEKGIDGCDGGEVGETLSYLGEVWNAGASGTDISFDETGEDEQGRPIRFSGTSRGSRGSGAYYGNNGTDGNDGINWATRGANGVNATTPSNATSAQFAKCGNGGHGSNAPSGGAGTNQYNGFYVDEWLGQGSAGLGASGSNGSAGSQGFALFLIYRS